MSLAPDLLEDGELEQEDRPAFVIYADRDMPGGYLEKLIPEMERVRASEALVRSGILRIDPLVVIGLAQADTPEEIFYRELLLATTEDSMKFWKDNRVDQEYEVPLEQLVDGFYGWAEKAGGLTAPIVRQVGLYLSDRSDGLDSWEPNDTAVLETAIVNDPRFKEKNRWRE